MKGVLFLIAMCTALASIAQKAIPLYPGVVPGSESWTWPEKAFKVPIGTVIMDASKSTLTAYLPAKPNGTAIIIAPGGAFHALALIWKALR